MGSLFKNGPKILKLIQFVYIIYSNMTSFFRFVNKRSIYRIGIISLEYAPVHVTDLSVVNVHYRRLEFGSINCVRHIPHT